MSDYIEDWYKALGARLRLLREQRGITQEAVAKKLGKKRASISNIEYGRQRMLAHDLAVFADAISVSLADVLSFESPLSFAEREWREAWAKVNKEAPRPQCDGGVLPTDRRLAP